MTTDSRLFLGFDPGGHRNFGVALITDSTARTHTVSTVTEAFEWAKLVCGSGQPIAAGIDTLLHWSDGPSGWRPADRWLIRKYPDSARSVVSPNSLFGAMAIGGMGLAFRLRDYWPTMVLNETHPKVLIPALGGQRYSDIRPSDAIDWFYQHSRLNFRGVSNGHELDALLSAWATRSGIDQAWENIVGNDASIIRPAGKVTYFWPRATALGGDVGSVLRDTDVQI